MAGFETEEQRREREARAAAQASIAAAKPPGQALGDMGLTRDEIRQGEEGAAWRERDKRRAAANVTAGTQLPGSYQDWGGQFKQDILRSNMSRGEAEAERRRQMGYGSGNNAETAAMIGDAAATADKYSTVFGDLSGKAGARSDAANARGTAMFAGDTGQYQTGLDRAGQSRGMQTGAYDALMGMANQGPGPSAAQAQLRQATDANTQNALAMARSGRGMGGGAASMRQAIGQNAATQQNAANAAAELRANENTAYQAQRLDAMKGAGTVAGQTVAADQGYAGLGLEGAKYQTDTTLRGTDLNDRTAQAWAEQQRANAAGAHGAEVTGHTEVQNINSQAVAARQAEEDAVYRQIALERGEVAAAQAARQATVNAVIGGTASAAESIIGSDVRGKTNIKPVGSLDITEPEPEPLTPGAPLGLNGVKPLAPAKPAAPMPTAAASPSAEDKRAAKGSAIGGTAGHIGGAALGGAVGGPVGALLGGAAGGVGGKLLGKLFSDVRAKTNIEPMSDASGSYGALDALAQKYGAAGVAINPKSVKRYADVSSKELEGERAERRFARDDSHPILSKGDALLADSARNAPPSAYDYKDPTAPGAKPGRQVGPMAQDLAAHPVTRGMVGTDPATGRLTVDGARAATVGLAQNHSQQNQLDALGGEIARLEEMLKRKPGDSRVTDFRRDQTAGGLL